MVVIDWKKFHALVIYGMIHGGIWEWDWGQGVAVCGIKVTGKMLMEWGKGSWLLGSRM